MLPPIPDALLVGVLSKDTQNFKLEIVMAKIILDGNDCVVIEARNIGLLKAVKDIASSELEGIEELAEETTTDALKAVPEGYDVVNVGSQLFSDGKNILVTVHGKKM